MKTHGWKTYLAAAVTAAVAVNRALGHPWWTPEMEQAILTGAGALGLVGVRAAIGRAAK